MAAVDHIRAFIQKWEGGLSNKSTDKAAANPAPWPYNGTYGWHTNKGVTYSTFASLGPSLGYAVTADNFFTMPAEIWDKILQAGFWNSWDLDNMKSQAIADLIADFAWGSGITGSFNVVKKYLAGKGKNVSTRTQATAALNDLARFNEKNVFLDLINARHDFFESLNEPANIKGWLNRLDALKTFGLQTIGSGSWIRILIPAALVLLALAITVLLYYRYRKSNLKIAA